MTTFTVDITKDRWGGILSSYTHTDQALKAKSTQRLPTHLPSGTPHAQLHESDGGR